MSTTPFSPRARYLSLRGSIAAILNTASRSALAITLAIAGGVGAALADPGELSADSLSVSEAPSFKDRYEQRMGKPFGDRVQVGLVCKTREKIFQILETSVSDMAAGGRLVMNSMISRECIIAKGVVAPVKEILDFKDITDPKYLGKFLMVMEISHPLNKAIGYTIGVYPNSSKSTPEKTGVRYRDV